MVFIGHVVGSMYPSQLDFPLMDDKAKSLTFGLTPMNPWPQLGGTFTKGNPTYFFNPLHILKAFVEFSVGGKLEYVEKNSQDQIETDKILAHLWRPGFNPWSLWRKA